MAVKPITPAEVKVGFLTTIPDEMIQAVNELLTENGNRFEITIKQKDIVERFKSIYLNKNGNGVVWDSKWLDFEPVFQKAGWKVYYDKPGYNESYDATFKFTPKRGVDSIHIQ